MIDVLELLNPLNIKFPFRNTHFTGVFEMNSKTIDMYKSDLYVLLMTKRGERAMMPFFGSPIYDFMFENINNDLIKLLEADIKQSVSTWIPEILIHKVNIENDLASGDNTLLIVVTFSLKQDVEEIEQIKIEVGL